MARRALIWHLFPTYLLLTIVSLLAVLGYSSTSLRAFYLDQVSLDLHSRAALLEDQIALHLRERDDVALQQLCETLGESSSTRITVILASGQVIADSEELPGAMDNHADRPEIQQAISGTRGSSTRFSDTLNKRMMYVAVPVGDSNSVPGVLRVALPITAIDDALWSLFMRIVYGSAIVALLAAIGSWVVSRRITRPLRDLRDGAQKFARGELDHQLKTRHSQEIDALAEAMNQMATELSERMDTVVRQKKEQQAVLSSMVEGVFAVDIEGRLISINQTAATLFDVDPEEATGRNVLEIIRNSSFRDFLSRALQSNGPIKDEIAFYLKEERIFQTHGTILQGESEQSLGAVIVLHDVTHIRRLERVRSDFVSNVSHELRTPITAIKGFIETLLDNPPSDREESKRFLEIVDRNATQLNTLIDDLLSLSRIEQGDIPVEEVVQRTTAHEILSQAQTMCQPMAKQRRVTLAISCDPTLEAQVHPSLLQQAVVNLIGNAIKFSEEGQKVLVEAVKDNTSLSIRVSDTGVGISPEHLPRLFERFYRVDQARSRELGGTGLGLAITKHIAELHGGSVHAESTLGKGSSFEIRIPITND